LTSDNVLGRVVCADARWTAREWQTANRLFLQPEGREVKLAESWIEDTPTGVALEDFHDEVEEVDEVDEAEDGCGGVVWQPYVLRKPNTSNKQLHELAREVRGVEKRRGRRLTVSHYKRTFDRWAFASRQFLKPGHDYFTEFLAKLDCVMVPKGETLQAAFDRAKRREPPPKVLIVRNQGCAY
jgi:hypothetical protein